MAAKVRWRPGLVVDERGSETAGWRWVLPRVAAPPLAPQRDSVRAATCVTQPLTAASTHRIP